jgi:hypothetical protein
LGKEDEDDGDLEGVFHFKSLAFLIKNQLVL